LKTEHQKDTDRKREADQSIRRKSTMVEKNKEMKGRDRAYYGKHSIVYSSSRMKKKMNIQHTDLNVRAGLVKNRGHTHPSPSHR